MGNNDLSQPKCDFLFTSCDMDFRMLSVEKRRIERSELLEHMASRECSTVNFQPRWTCLVLFTSMTRYDKTFSSLSKIYRPKVMSAGPSSFLLICIFEALLSLYKRPNGFNATNQTSNHQDYIRSIFVTRDSCCLWFKSMQLPRFLRKLSPRTISSPMS
ncbi:hypothetical protein GALMADRAFT_1274671 [Galerina marginata CBS 339.88]|uniref:Uncharacterized protein n=1 Tax=Galerina marginata (strain CBS 339.88) TaxID=685588 RepID=A0A067T924_GALM3|nr:hypothetical protein GALMADRAFT_1274671 [Galerina marginata CBS 339.88]